MKQIIRYVKIFIARGQQKRFKQYLLNDNKNNTKEKIEEKLSLIKQSYNPTWFLNRFVTQKKHIEDVETQLQDLISYGKLNQELQTFDFKNASFADLHQFLSKFKSHQVKTKKFKAPQVCELILTKGNYKFYYADAYSNKCFNDLHKCNMIDDKKQNNNENQYAKWCVVVGTVDWGTYTNDQFPFYVYVTDSKNEPIMLFNFGYDQDAQIKDIHDDPFSNYDQDLIIGIKELAKKYNFDISENEDDFAVFNKYSQIYYEDVNEFDLSKVKNEDKNKFGGLYLIYDTDTAVIIDLNKMQKAYFVVRNKLCKLNGYSYNNQNLINLLIEKNEGYILSLALKSEKITNIKLAKKIIDFFDETFYSHTLYFLLEDIVKAKWIVNQEQLLKRIAQICVENNQIVILYSLMENNDIIEQNLKIYILDIFLSKKPSYFRELIKKRKIDDKTLEKYIPKIKEQMNIQLLTQLIMINKIKDNKIIEQVINKSIIDKEYDCFYKLIEKNKITDENLIERMIEQSFNDGIYNNNTHYMHYYICDIIHKNKIKNFDLIAQIIIKQGCQGLDEVIYKMIKQNKIKNIEIKNKLIDKMIKQFYLKPLYCLIMDNVITDKNIIRKYVEAYLIDNMFDHSLINLIKDKKITDENLIKEIKSNPNFINYCSDWLIDTNTMEKIKTGSIVKYVRMYMKDKKQHTLK